MTDGVFRTAAQVESALRLPCVGLIPRMRGLRAQQAHRGDPQRRIAASGRSVDLLIVGEPTSHYAESIRAIEIELELGPTSGRCAVIGITSALPNEGKTTIAVSLARLMAHAGKRVILVDGDLRNPTLSAAMAPGATVGLIEVVKKGKPLEEALWKDPHTELDILPAMHRELPLHTSEFLASAATRALFDRLRAEYDHVIVDLPPLSPVVDARASVAFIDGYVLAIEWGKTRIEKVKRALQQASNVQDSIITVVLNKTDMKAMPRYDRSEANIHNYDLYLNRQAGRPT